MLFLDKFCFGHRLRGFQFHFKPKTSYSVLKAMSMSTIMAKYRFLRTKSRNQQKEPYVDNICKDHDILRTKEAALAFFVRQMSRYLHVGAHSPA